MISLLTGENSFELGRALMALQAAHEGSQEVYEGSELERAMLPDLLMGTSLFSSNRLVIIKNLSDNKVLWTDFGDWLARLSDDIHLVLVEPKPDKRLKTYKDIQKIATVQEYKLWGERDAALAEKWLQQEASAEGLTLKPAAARLVVQRVGLDQWALYQALQKLAVLDEITEATIEATIEPSVSENVFYVFEAALKGQRERVQAMIRSFQLTEDPYRLFGLLSAQAFQLVALAAADKPAAEVAKDLGAHPFALSKIAGAAKKLSPSAAKKIINAFSEADDAMKTSVAEPWLLLERALMKVAAASEY